MRLPNHVSESIKRRNPSLFLGRLDSQVAQPDNWNPLVKDSPAPKKGTSSLVYRVVLVAHRKRLVDSDNNVASLKNLRDCIAETLRIDDGDDERLSWTYGQVKTDGKQGVCVTIEKV